MSDLTWGVQDLAHIVQTEKWAEVKAGAKTKVKSLCGSFIRHAVPNHAPVCRDCFERQMERDIATAKENELAGTTAAT